MTVDEKRAFLQRHCYETECYNCALFIREGEDCGISIHTANEDKLDSALNKINGVEPNDVVNRPAHYTDGKIEVIDFIEDKKLGFCLGNAVKYIARAGKKDPTKEVEDLKKAEWYIKRRIKELEEV